MGTTRKALARKVLKRKALNLNIGLTRALTFRRRCRA